MTEPTAPTDDVWTVQRILQWTTTFLEEKEVESPRLEAELLLAHARGCQRIRLYTDFETPLTDDERSLMRGFVKRRANREPLAYITGKREFYGRDFHVGAGVLVPRPETETLVDVCLDYIPNDSTTNVGEVGFGSGCISITLAKQRPRLSVAASDISSDAMKFAQQNLTLHELEDQIQLLAGDGYQPFTDAGLEPFDGIVSNPPYITTEEVSSLAPEVARHEPHTALVSGDDGLDLIRQLITQASDHLKPGGWMALELDPAQSESVAELFMADGFEEVRIHKDLGGQDRVVAATLKGDSQQ